MGKVVVIGGSTGIGSALAERLAGQGHRVFATFNRHERPDSGSLSFHRCEFSSVAASTGFGYHAVVASSKGAIEGLTVALAAEWAPRIRVNAIAPSLTNTPLAATLLNTPEKREPNAQRHPLKRVGEPAELAATAAFLLSEEASWMTGQILHADGGIGRLQV